MSQWVLRFVESLCYPNLDYRELVRAQYVLSTRVHLGDVEKMSYLDFLLMTEFMVEDAKKPENDSMKDMLKNVNRHHG